MNADRSEAYKILSDLFLGPPDADTIRELKEDLELKSKDTPEEILEDYVFLFKFPGGRLVPIESVAVGSAGAGIADRVAGYYSDAGLTIDQEFGLPPDHLALELLFLSYLVDTDNMDLMENFLDEHVMNWVPYYCQDVTEMAKTVFYREVSAITKDFLESEYEGLE